MANASVKGCFTASAGIESSFDQAHWLAMRRQKCRRPLRITKWRGEYRAVSKLSSRATLCLRLLPVLFQFSKMGAQVSPRKLLPKRQLASCVRAAGPSRRHLMSSGLPSKGGPVRLETVRLEIAQGKRETAVDAHQRGRALGQALNKPFSDTAPRPVFARAWWRHHLDGRRRAIRLINAETSQASCRRLSARIVNADISSEDGHWSDLTELSYTDFQHAPDPN